MGLEELVQGAAVLKREPVRAPKAGGDGGGGEEEEEEEIIPMSPKFKRLQACSLRRSRRGGMEGSPHP